MRRLASSVVLSLSPCVVPNVQGCIVGRRHSEGAIEKRGHGMCSACDNLIGVLYTIVAGSTACVVAA
jgi:hypothetical protein